MLYFGFSRLLRIRQPVADVQMAAEGAPFSVDIRQHRSSLAESVFVRFNVILRLSTLPFGAGGFSYSALTHAYVMLSAA